MLPPALPPALPAPLPAPAELKPKLVTMIEPAVPQHVLDQLTRREYGVNMTIRADGSVADVAVAPPAPRQLQRYVAEALERWKFEPLPADRSHRVVLVFNPVR
jgi:hypothetical protein